MIMEMSGKKHTRIVIFLEIELDMVRVMHLRDLPCGWYYKIVIP